MLKWAHICQRETVETVESYDTKEEAIKNAERNWEDMDRFARKNKYNHEIVGLVNLDEKDVYIEDENGNIDSDIREIAWQDGEYEQGRVTD